MTAPVRSHACVIQPVVETDETSPQRSLAPEITFREISCTVQAHNRPVSTPTTCIQPPLSRSRRRSRSAQVSTRERSSALPPTHPQEHDGPPAFRHAPASHARERSAVHPEWRLCTHEGAVDVVRPPCPPAYSTSRQRSRPFVVALYVWRAEEPDGTAHNVPLSRLRPSPEIQVVDAADRFSAALLGK
ncbi:hypothetical protein VTO73DRAFT_12310 [Trametes versicolor]